MQEIDRLGWAGGISFQAQGWRIGIRTNTADAVIAERIEASLPPGWRADVSPFVDMLYSLRLGSNTGRFRRFHLLFAPLQPAARTMDLDSLFEALEDEIQLFVAEHSREHIFVRGGVVGWKGRGVLLPGRARADTSSLVGALVRAGATYFSDRYAVLDGQGRVRPFPRRLAPVLGSRTATEPWAVDRVVLTDYRAGTRWQPRPLTAGQTILELLPHTLSAVARPSDALAVLERVALGSVAFKGPHGDAEETAALLLDAA